MHRRLVVMAALLAATLAPRVARAGRPPLQSDIDRCTLKAEDTGRANLSGRHAPRRRGGQDSSQALDRGWSGSSPLGIRLGYGFPG